MSGRCVNFTQGKATAAIYGIFFKASDVNVYETNKKRENLMLHKNRKIVFTLRPLQVRRQNLRKHESLDQKVLSSRKYPDFDLETGIMKDKVRLSNV